MSQNTLSSTQQQDQVGRSNNAQMRRHCADRQASQGADVFANLLQQAAEAPEPEAPATEPTDTEKAIHDPADKPDASDWFALTQAYSAPRTPSAADTASPTVAPADATPELPDGIDTSATVADPEATLSPEPDAEALVDAAPTAPRRAPGRTVSAAAQTLSTVGAPTERGDATLAAPLAAGASAGAALPPAQTGAVPQAWHMAVAGRPGGREAPAVEGGTGEPTTPLPPGLEKVLAARGGDAGGLQADVQAGQDSGNPIERSGESPEPPTTDNPAWGDSWGDAMEDLGHQISYWLGRGVKQAQIQVDTGLGRPLEVALSLDKGQAMLHFQTDNAAARQAIESGAADILKGWLARDGIGLAGLSVGSQDRGGQPGNEPQPHRRALGLGAEPAGPLVEGASAPVRQSHRVLDLYA